MPDQSPGSVTVVTDPDEEAPEAQPLKARPSGSPSSGTASPAGTPAETGTGSPTPQDGVPPDHRPSGQGWFVVLPLICLAVAAVGWLLGGKAAGYLLSVALLALAAVRARLTAGRVGLLVVRSRAVDVGVMLGFALVLIAVTASLPD